MDFHGKIIAGDTMRFKRIYIEITNTCNLHCSFCIQNSRTPQRMTIPEFTHILQEIRPYCEYIYLHVLGEPLSHPDLDSMLRIACEQGFYVNITTNGTLLYQQAKLLKQHTIRQINISLHSFPQHQQQNYLHDVFQASEQLAKQGIYINYRLWSLKNSELSSETVMLLDEIAARYAIDLDKDKIHRLQRLALSDHISLHFEEVFTWPSLLQPYVNDRGRCLGMKDMCAILVNGDVVPCCLDSRGDCVLGNIHRTAFSNILCSPRAQTMVNEFARHHVSEELCRHCTYRLRFSKERTT